VQKGKRKDNKSSIFNSLNLIYKYWDSVDSRESRIHKAEADPEEEEREARTVEENSCLTDAEFRSADEEKKE